MTNVSDHKCARKQSWKVVGVVNYVNYWRGSGFYAFLGKIFTRTFWWPKFREINQILTKLWYCVPIGHFTVVCLVTWPLSGSEAGGDLVLIQTPAFHM